MLYISTAVIVFILTLVYKETKQNEGLTHEEIAQKRIQLQLSLNEIKRQREADRRQRIAALKEREEITPEELWDAIRD